MVGNLHHRGLYRYNEAMKEYMQRYKFNGDYRLRVVFQRELSKVVNEQKADLIVPDSSNVDNDANAWL